MRIFACSFLVEFKAHIRYFLKITPQKIQCAINIQCAYFLYFHIRQSFFLLRTRLRPPPPHTATFHSYIFPRTQGCREIRHPSIFPKKNYPFPTISRISLDKSPPFLYNIWTYVLFPLGQLSGARLERRRLPPQNRSAPGKNSKGVVKRDSLCRKEGFPIAGDSGNEG